LGTVTAAPSWILNAAVDWVQGPLSLDLNTRFVSGGRYSATYTASDLDSAHLLVPSNITFNTSVHYIFRSVVGTPELYLQVQNLFDKDPPIVPGGASLIGFQTLSSLYDTMGRFFSAGIRLTF
jgi:outer membrane receptor protein involved in Fe transport